MIDVDKCKIKVDCSASVNRLLGKEIVLFLGLYSDSYQMKVIWVI